MGLWSTAFYHYMRRSKKLHCFFGVSAYVVPVSERRVRKTVINKISFLLLVSAIQISLIIFTYKIKINLEMNYSIKVQKK